MSDKSDSSEYESYEELPELEEIFTGRKIATSQSIADMFQNFAFDMKKNVKTIDINDDESINTFSENLGVTLGEVMKKMMGTAKDINKNIKKQMDVDDRQDSEVIKNVLIDDALGSPELINLKNDLKKRMEIHAFLGECIKEFTLTDALTLAKEKFDLPDGYKLDVMFKVVFGADIVVETSPI
jgi:hypothetical protein